MNLKSIVVKKQWINSDTNDTNILDILQFHCNITILYNKTNKNYTNDINVLQYLPVLLPVMLFHWSYLIHEIFGDNQMISNVGLLE